MANATDLESLRAEWRAGHRVTFFMFWGHRESGAGGVGKWCLSQWWPAEFSVEDVRYPTAEHFMMAAKARLFGDTEALARILAEPSPAVAKKAGRQVRGFDERKWTAERYRIVIQGNLAKFDQNPELRSYLLSVREDVFVEASPVDTIWGIGVRQTSPEARNPERWRGLNLLGFALTAVRRELRSEGAPGGPTRPI